MRLHFKETKKKVLTETEKEELRKITLQIERMINAHGGPNNPKQPFWISSLKDARQKIFSAAFNSGLEKRQKEIETTLKRKKDVTQNWGDLEISQYRYTFLERLKRNLERKKIQQEELDYLTKLQHLAIQFSPEVTANSLGKQQLRGSGFAYSEAELILRMGYLPGIGIPLDPSEVPGWSRCVVDLDTDRSDAYVQIVDLAGRDPDVKSPNGYHWHFKAPNGWFGEEEHQLRSTRIIGEWGVSWSWDFLCPVGFLDVPEGYHNDPFIVIPPTHGYHGEVKPLNETPKLPFALASLVNLKFVPPEPSMRTKEEQVTKAERVFRKAPVELRNSGFLEDYSRNFRKRGEFDGEDSSDTES